MDRDMSEENASKTCAYGFHAHLAPMPFRDAASMTIDALKTEGFGVLTDIDVQSTMTAKLGINVRPYRILGACSPSLAQRALAAEPDIGLLLPCNVTVREEADGSIIVGFMDSIAILQMTHDREVAAVAKEVRQRLGRVCQILTG